jgi:hypothetical protein
MSNRRIFDAPFAGPHLADHDLAGIDADAYENRQSAGLAQSVGVALDPLLEFEPGVDCALGMIFVRGGSTEQGENSVPGGLHHMSVETADYLDHES